jgi:hypothetical protein
MRGRTTGVISMAIALAAGCTGAPARTLPPAPPATAPRAPEERRLGPARWAIFDRMGAVFDEAGRGSLLPRPEPAIIDGARVIVDAGVIVAPACERRPEHLGGFRSLPARLGGGFVLWTEGRVYRAEEFWGAASPIADVGASGGARPWLQGALLRTPLGLLALDPRSLALHRAPFAGVADALAVDARRAARLDVLGRASVTADGGASWTDVLATRGVVVSALSETAAGDLLLAGAPARLVVGADGVLSPARDPSPSRGGESTDPQPALAGLASSRVLPGETLAHGVAYGALVAGGRIVVGHESGVRVLATATGLSIADSDLGGLDARFSRCQAVAAGSPPAVLACVADTGAAVLDLDGPLSRPALEATFPAGGGGFVTGPRDRLAFDGRCGPERPQSTDLGPGTAKPQEPGEEGQAAPPPPPEPPGPLELPPADEARVCVRAARSRWVGHLLTGDDARRLYRWVPGDDGTVTALVLLGGDDDGETAAHKDHKDAGKPGAVPSTPPPEPVHDDGLRVVRVDAGDPALGGGAFPAVLTPQKDAPHRSADPAFWLDDDGSVRGWIRLPPAGEEKLAAPPSAQGPAHRVLPVTPSLGGRSAGVRIDAAGHVTVLPLPEGVGEVVTGGRFALATAAGEPRSRWFETVDGGATWTPVEGPPAGKLEAPGDESATFGCSPAGCAWSSGVVRLGWGGPPPEPADEPAIAPSPSPAPSFHEPEPLALTCRIDDAPAKPPASRKAPPPPIALRLPVTSLGSLRDHAWTGEVLAPFDPAAGPRHVSVTDRALNANAGSFVPVLGPSRPVDLLLLMDRRRLRAGGGPTTLLPFDVRGKATIAADGPGGSLVVLDAEHGTVWLARGDAVAPALHLTRVPEVSRLRLTLARRLAAGLALAGYSTSSGDVVAGDLDLGRAQVGALAALGRLDAMAEAGACPGATHRMLVELPVKIRVAQKGGEAVTEEGTASALIVAGAGAVCVEAVEAVVRKGGTGVLRATLGPGGSASVWRDGANARGICSLAKR